MLSVRNYKIDGCFVDDDFKFALIHIYKNASISMRNALNIRGKYHNWADIKDKNITTLCVIRNPYERIVSIYQYLLRLEDNGFIDKHPTNITKETEFYKKRDNPIVSFELFLEYIKNDNFYDAVTLPQIQFLSDRDLKISDIDEIFIQEKMDLDFNRFIKKYNLNIELGEFNKGNNEISVLLNFYVTNTPKVQDTIKKLYYDDIKLYKKLLNEK